MTITRMHLGERGPLRPGDAVFHWEPEDQEFSLHVGIYVGPEQPGPDRAAHLRVRGLPCTPSDASLGESLWNQEGAYHADVIGRHGDADPVQLRDVVLLSQRVAAEHSQIGTICGFRSKLVIRALPSGFPLFIAGSCSQFIEYLYEQSGLDLIDQRQTFNPRDPQRLYPSVQIRAFWRESYPLIERPWHDSMGSYPSCIEAAPR